MFRDKSVIPIPLFGILEVDAVVPDDSPFLSRL